jgi:hypothetical protein
MMLLATACHIRSVLEGFVKPAVDHHVDIVSPLRIRSLEPIFGDYS